MSANFVCGDLTCSGCGACVEACPFHALSMKEWPLWRARADCRPLKLQGLWAMSCCLPRMHSRRAQEAPKDLCCLEQ